MLGAVASSDFVHECVAHAFERRSGLARATVDAGKLLRRIAGVVDVLQQRPDVALPLCVEPSDLVALPEPRPRLLLLRGGGRSKSREQNGDDDEPLHPDRVGGLSTANWSVTASSRERKRKTV